METLQPRAVAVIRCKDTGKKLARRNERGIYLFCKECGCEEFFSWEEILPQQESAPVTAEPAPAPTIA